MVNEDRSVAAKGIPMWSGEIKDFKGWYTQFSAYCSTIEEGADVIALLRQHKSDGGISDGDLAAAASADAVLWSQLAQAMKPHHARFTVVEDNPWYGIIVLRTWEQYVFGEETRSKSAVWTALMSAARRSTAARPSTTGSTGSITCATVSPPWVRSCPMA